jgi:hypothetical protein
VITFNKEGNDFVKKLCLTLLLVTPFSFADWGDVYHCEMTNFSEVTLDGDKKNSKLGKFKFKLDKNRNAMVFGKGGYFENRVGKLDSDYAWVSKETWEATHEYGRYVFNNGKLLHSFVRTVGITTVTANCDKF